jgi:uncharacterized membrane protein YsdA (DUF1294 family)
VIAGASLFIVALFAAAVLGTVPFAVPVGYLAISIVTFGAYGADKSAARAHTWRTPETTLHVLALVGGWPGAAIAQAILHHKSKKTSFQVTFWATVACNCGALAWLWQARLFTR